ncbi:MAG: hypothetical protein ABI986_00590 [Chloroflexota bacterium]
MKVNLDNKFEFEFFQIEELKNAEQFAEEINGSIYSWKTTGLSNWLERGVSIVDVLGITVLPSGLPDSIDLPDDKE